MGEKPIKSLDITGAEDEDALKALIPRRKKTVVESNGTETNGAHRNGVEIITATTSKSSIKRTASEATQEDSPLSKRPKTISNGVNGTTGDDDVLLIEDTLNGAILIND